MVMPKPPYLAEPSEHTPVLPHSRPLGCPAPSHTALPAPPPPPCLQQQHRHSSIPPCLLLQPALSPRDSGSSPSSQMETSRPYHSISDPALCQAVVSGYRSHSILSILLLATQHRHSPAALASRALPPGTQRLLHPPQPPGWQNSKATLFPTSLLQSMWELYTHTGRGSRVLCDLDFSTSLLFTPATPHPSQRHICAHQALLSLPAIVLAPPSSWKIFPPPSPLRALILNSPHMPSILYMYKISTLPEIAIVTLL